MIGGGFGELSSGRVSWFVSGGGCSMWAGGGS